MLPALPSDLTLFAAGAFPCARVCAWCAYERVCERGALARQRLAADVIVMAYIVMAYIVMAYIVMAYIVMAYIVMACIVIAYIGCDLTKYRKVGYV